jgi:hypothetical protein
MSVRPRDLAEPNASLFDGAGEPQLGSFRGALPSGDLAPVRTKLGPVRALASEKAWVYGIIASDDVLASFAIVDVGYANNAFLYVADPRGALRARDSALGIPRVSAHVGPGALFPCEASFRFPRSSYSIARGPDETAYHVRIETPSTHLEVAFETRGAPPPISVVGRLRGGDVAITEKQALLRVRGGLVVRGERRTLDDAFAGLDYTHGFLPRHTVWRWAYFLGRAACGTRVAMNVVEGFNGAPECCLWVGDELVGVAEASFRFTHDDHLAPWTIRTPDGAVDLTFQPSGMYADVRDLAILKSKFRQPFGLFAGTLRLADGRELVLEEVPGVVEDQDMLW